MSDKQEKLLDVEQSEAGRAGEIFHSLKEKAIEIQVELSKANEVMVEAMQKEDLKSLVIEGVNYYINHTAANDKIQSRKV